MKKSLLFLLSAAMFVSCSKKSDTQPAISGLVGVWYPTKDTTYSYQNKVLVTQSAIAYDSKANNVQFNIDGTALLTVGEVTTPYTEPFTYSQSGSKVVFDYPAQTINGVQQPAYIKSGTIKTLTSTNLVILYTSSKVVAGQTDSLAEVQYFTSN